MPKIINVAWFISMQNTIPQNWPQVDEYQKTQTDETA